MDSAPPFEPVVPPPAPPRREPFWGWADVGLAAVALPVAIVAVTAVLGSVLIALHHPLNTAVPILAVQTVLYAVAFALVWLILMLRHTESFWDALRWRVPPILGLKLFGAGALLALLAGLLGALLRTPQVDNPIVALMRDPASIVVVGVFASTIGPLAEEIFFRGFLQPVATRSLGLWGGVGFTSLIFASMHGAEYHWRWQYLLIVFTASLAFGWIRHRLNSTGASTLVHAGYNLLFFIGYFIQGRNISTHG